MTEHARETLAQFLVRVRFRDGRVQDMAAARPEQATRAVARLALRPGVEEAHWMVHPDLGLPVPLAGRYAADVPGIGERRRVTHLFLIEPGVSIGPVDAVTAWCGEPIRLDQLEMLAEGTGMPCYRCRASLPDAMPGEPR
jgi:hypothetical protein